MGGCAKRCQAGRRASTPDGRDRTERSWPEHAPGFDRDLPQEQRLFLYLPLEHSEALADQQDCVNLMGKLDANPDWCSFAQRHRDNIARFGQLHKNNPNNPANITKSRVKSTSRMKIIKSRITFL